MKKHLIILFLILVNSSFGQSYYSPLTQYLHLDQIETISRNIEIEPDRILIVTNTLDNEYVQMFKILSIEEKRTEILGLSSIYNCTSKDGKFITKFIVPKTSPIQFIDAIQPTQFGDARRHYRFLLDTKSKKII